MAAGSTPSDGGAGHPGAWSWVLGLSLVSARPGHHRVQASRARLREGALGDVAGRGGQGTRRCELGRPAGHDEAPHRTRGPARRGRGSCRVGRDRARSRLSRCATWASSTTCASPRRPRCGRASPTCSIGSRATGASGRCARRRSPCAGANRWASSGPTARARARCCSCSPGSSRPSEGLVEVNGHISTLLSLQAGLRPGPVGLDNIALAGALLGIPHETMVRITPDIVEFADIGAFIDAPLKTYSSGMRARLGFRHRDRGRPRHPAARRGPPDRRRGVPREEPAAHHLRADRGQGGGPGDPRHDLGHRVLHPRHPHRGWSGDDGRCPRGRRASAQGALRSTAGSTAGGDRADAAGEIAIETADARRLEDPDARK